MWRFFNLTSFIFTKKYSVQDMKDKTLPYFLAILPTICHIKIFNLTFFSYYKNFHPSPLQNK